LWNVAQFTPIHAFDAYTGVGKIYKVTAGGIMSTGASGTLTITPRIGNSATPASNVSMGISGAQTVTPSVTNVPWFMNFVLVVRTLGAPGANSTCDGIGVFNANGAIATAASNNTVTFGGTAAANVDFSVETGIFIGWTLSVAGSCTPHFAYIESLN
jgi:hypothetical protein